MIFWHRLLYDGYGEQKPLLGLHAATETILELDVQAGFAEKRVQQGLQFFAVDVGEPVSRDDVHPREEIDRVFR